MLFSTKVSKEEGQIVADQYSCPFDEFSAAETAALQSQGQQRTVKTAFNKLIRQLLSQSHSMPHYPRLRFTAFSKLIGAFVSKTRHATNNKLQRDYSQDNKSRYKSHSMDSTSSSSSSRSGNSSISDISVATITSELSNFRLSSPLHITPPPTCYDVGKTLPIPIVGRNTLNNYPMISNHEVASSV